MANEHEQEPEASAPAGVLLRLLWTDEGVPTGVFATQLLIAAHGDYHVVSFGQVVEPTLSPDDQEAIERLRSRGTVEVRTVARIAIPSSHFGAVSAAFARHAAQLSEGVSQEGVSDDGV
jgi:hypothetical protein